MIVFLDRLRHGARVTCLVNNNNESEAQLPQLHKREWLSEVYVDVGRGRRRPQSNWHVASFTVKTVQWALSETANMQLQQRDELQYICTRFLCDFCHRVKWKLYNLTLDVAG